MFVWLYSTFVSWLAVDGDRIVGTSGMSFVEKPPYFGSPNGKIGLLSSMYTANDYRRQGIAKGWTQISEIMEQHWGGRACDVTTVDGGIIRFFQIDQ